MKCSKCDCDLMVSKCKPKSDIDTTDVFMVQTLVCVNPGCALYCGNDLSNPTQIAQTIESKV